MELLVEKAGEVTVVVPKVEFLDANTSREFKDELPGALGQGGKVVLDLQHVQFMDSGGCGALLTVLKQLKAGGGNLKICCVTNPVRALFDLVRMHRIIEIFKTRAEAVAALAK